MDLHNPFVTGFYFQASFMLWHLSEFPNFFRLNGIPLHVYPTVNLKKKKAQCESVIGGKMRTAVWESSHSDSSEKLLQRGRGEGQHMYDFGEGRIRAIKHIFFYFSEGFC